MPPVCDPTGSEPCRVNLVFLPEGTQLTVWIINAIVVAVLAYGLWSHWRMWKQGAAGSTGASFWLHLKRLIVVSVFQKKVLRRGFAGTMHVLLYTGFIALGIGTVIVFLNSDILANFNIDILVGNPYLVYEFALEFMGLAFLVGLALVFYRRLVSRPKYLVTGRGDLYLPGILVLLLLQGFLLEAM